MNLPKCHEHINHELKCNKCAEAARLAGHTKVYGLVWAPGRGHMYIQEQNALNFGELPGESKFRSRDKKLLLIKGE